MAFEYLLDREQREAVKNCDRQSNKVCSDLVSAATVVVGGASASSSSTSKAGFRRVSNKPTLPLSKRQREAMAKMSQGTDAVDAFF